MLKILPFVLSFMISAIHFSKAQTVDGVALADIESTYIELTRRGKIFNRNIQLEVDFGQDRSKGRINDSQVTDENGRLVEFNSMVDALNFFDRLGYEYIDRADVGENQPLQYLLRRKKEELDLANSPARE
ncbi:hypothetical protein [Algoriphagus hitonicola]|uniref:Uncharacterized protein n=1 Tax=Algoriphagus hitonicola TaxID=435880 RepID=A0A1I2NT65_9BACT|nr:hypothetical protein [Algoriphagus hitonicola]SFG07062.1 hypothetical protein SAMN04487988_101298 [Algoriphagus hitonicola]